MHYPGKCSGAFKGVYSPKESEKGLKKIKALLEAFVILPIDDDACDMFGELSAELKRRGESIGDFDELIAAIALVHGATMVSSDGHFRRVPGLKIDSRRFLQRMGSNVLASSRILFWQ